MMERTHDDLMDIVNLFLFSLLLLISLFVFKDEMNTSLFHPSYEIAQNNSGSADLVMANVR